MDDETIKRDVITSPVPSPLRKAATAYAEAEIERQRANPHRKQWSQLTFVNAFMAGALWAVRQERAKNEY